jgi:flagellar biosynthesis protein FlhA
MASAEATWDDLTPVDTLGLEVGYRLIALVDKARQGDLLGRIKGVRKKFAQDVGFLPPPVHIRDNLELKPSVYRVTLRGAVVGEGEAFPGMLLAINPGRRHPASCPARAPPTRPSACPRCGSTSATRKWPRWPDLRWLIAPTVVATHLSHLMQVNAAKLLGRVSRRRQLVEHVTKLAPKLIEDVVPKMVGIATLQTVLQLLLEEGVHIRDMRSIVECLAEHAATVTDPAELAAASVCTWRRPSCSRSTAGEGAGRDRARPELERLVTQALTSPHGAALDPGVADTLTRSAADTAQKQEDLGLPACLLVPDLIRAPMARLLKRAAPRLKVLGTARSLKPIRSASARHRSTA